MACVMTWWQLWGFAQGHETNVTQGATCGSAAGAVASAATCPLDVVKTRMMLGSKTKGGARRAAGRRRGGLLPPSGAASELELESGARR